ncbi:response regulator transcription factor [Actinoplanes friuliensis]|uniref:Response regulator mprA n=1 Tax=Actinoplanes friuliensis DSM 7358 TaxID=1246995 RepID=U5VT39_9ACTN|nr:response regulator [Actinoplanes friuliensis]AGZ38816.1 response regulator mprA [Actinoplanes friuliensis DSM 7358]
MPTVLIADDDADHRELITLALAKLGHRSVEAADGETALRLADAGGIDAVLLDVRMPGLSGIELCRRLRSEPATAHLPIMMISADVNGHRILAGMDAGADDYLTKPYHRSELFTRLETLLGRKRTPVNKPATAASAALLAARGGMARPVPAAQPLRRTA